MDIRILACFRRVLGAEAGLCGFRVGRRTMRDRGASSPRLGRLAEHATIKFGFMTRAQSGAGFAVRFNGARYDCGKLRALGKWSGFIRRGICPDATQCRQAVAIAARHRASECA